MATVTATRAATTYTVELTEEEALYVLDALRLVDPAREQFGENEDEDDPVYGALSDALRGHAAYFGSHARLA